MFLDNSQLTAAHHTASLPLLILIHHIIVRSSSNKSSLQLPHKIYGWSESDYSKWLDEHNEDEAIELVKGCVRTSEESETNKEELVEEKMIRNLLKERAGIEV